MFLTTGKMKEAMRERERERGRERGRERERQGEGLSPFLHINAILVRGQLKGEL